MIRSDPDFQVPLSLELDCVVLVRFIDFLLCKLLRLVMLSLDYLY
jgi:hypothetical protein